MEYNATQKNTTPKVKSLNKALTILECFTANNYELGVTEISKMLNLHKSNVHNILHTFTEAGYLEQNSDNGKYYLSLKMLEFSYIANKNLGFQQIIYDVMRVTANELNSVVYFAIPNNYKILYLHAAYPSESAYSIPVRSILGETAPMHCTSLGKVMLAYSEDEVRDKVFNDDLVPFTSNTITDVTTLKSHIKEIILQRYSLDSEEHEAGIKCIGVPVFDSNRKLIGALSRSSSINNFDDDKIPYYLIKLEEAAFQIRNRL